MKRHSHKARKSSLTAPSVPVAFAPRLTLSLVLSLSALLPQISQAETDSSAHKQSRRELSIESLKRLNCQQAILEIIPVVIADARKPLKEKDNAHRLAADLQFLTKALCLDENEIAAAQLERASVELDPTNVSYQALLADYLARAGYPEDAAKIFKSFSITDTADPMMVKMLTVQRIRSADPPGALELTEKFAARKDLKNDPWFLVIRARTWLKAGYNKRAAPLFQEAANQADSLYCKHLWQAIAAKLQNQEEKATSELKEAGECIPDDPVWHTDMASELSLSDINASREQLFAALASKRVYSRAMLTNINYLQSHGLLEHASNCLDYYARLRPRSAELYFARARLAKAQGNLSKSLSNYESGLELTPRSAPNLTEKAAILRDLKQPEKSLEALKRLTEQCPNLLQSWLTYGESLLQTGDIPKAESAFRKGLTLVPKLVEEENILYRNEVGDLHANLATILYKQGKRSEALAHAEQFNHFKVVLDLPPAMRMLNMRPARLPEKVTMRKETEIRECVFLADALFECKDYKDSAAEYRKAIRIDGTDADLHSYLLNSLTESGDWAAAAGEDFHLSDSLVRKGARKFSGFFHR